MLAHAKNFYEDIKAETIRGLAQGDEIMLSFLVGRLEMQEVAVVWFTNGTKVITNNGRLIRVGDGVHVEPTGNHFESFSHSPKAEEKFQLLKKGYYDVKIINTKSEPE